MNDQPGGSISAITLGRTDAKIAEEYRARMLAALGEVLDIINEARRDHAMTIGFQISGPDGFNRQSLALLEVSKKLC
jgi:hypothetical protein